MTEPTAGPTAGPTAEPAPGPTAGTAVEPAAPGRRTTSTTRSGRAVGTNLVLGVLVVALLSYLLVVLVRGGSALPGTTPAERTEATYAQVRKAVSAVVLDFLHVDYRNMDPLTAKVVARSTGRFAKQYAATRVNLKAAAKAARATSTGKVRSVGISSLTGDQVGDTATVFVAADSVVSNKSTKQVERTKACPHDGAACRYYRFKIRMTLTDAGWKMSRLDFVS